MVPQELLQELVRRGIVSPESVADLLERSCEFETVNELVDTLVGRDAVTGHQAVEIQSGCVDRLQLGQYILLQPLGRGGMGVVYLARHNALGKRVALKVLPEEFSSDRQRRSRFQREMETLAKLSHPHIANTFDGGEEDGRLYFVMEYLSGGTLADRVRTNGPLSVDDTLSRMIETCDAVEYAHRMGIVHRDLKPSNLGIDEFGHIKVLDLGLAQIASDTDGYATTIEQITKEGQLVGTVDFMAPEQARNSGNADHRVDIYSLGCTLFSLLSGGPPFKGDSILEKVAAHQKAPPPSLTQFRPEAPQDLENLFRWMIAKRPSERPDSAALVLTRLQDIAATYRQQIAGSTIRQNPISGSISNPSSYPSGGQVVSQRNATFWLSMVALVMAASTLGIIISSRFMKSPPLANRTNAETLPAPSQTEATREQELLVAPTSTPTPTPTAAQSILDWIVSNGGEVWVSGSKGETVRWLSGRPLARPEQVIDRVVLRGDLSSETRLATLASLANLRELEFHQAILGDRTLGYVAIPDATKTVSFVDTPITSNGLATMGVSQTVRSLVFDRAGISDQNIADIMRWAPRLTNLQLTGNRVSAKALGESRPVTSLRTVVCDAALLAAESQPWFERLSRLKQLTLVGEPAADRVGSLHPLLQINQFAIDSPSLSPDVVKAISEVPWLRRITLRNIRSPISSIEALASSPNIHRIIFDDAVLSYGDVKRLQQISTGKYWAIGPTHEFESRNAASQLLALGAKLDVATLGKPVDSLVSVDQLPDEPFQIRSLELSGVKDLPVPALATLRGLFGLTKLALGDSGLTNAHLDVVADLTAVQSIDLSSGRFTDAGLAKLASLRNLTHLDFRDVTGCTHIGLEPILRATTNLTGIVSNSIPLSNGCYEALEDDRDLKGLFMLCGAGQGLTDDLFSSIVQLKELEAIHLGIPGIKGTRLGELAQCPKLKHLYLPGQIAVNELAQLRHVPSLSKIGINAIDSAKLQSVLDLPGVTDLACYSGVLGAQDLGDLFASEIRDVHLHNIDIDDAMVLENLPDTSRLTSLQLESTLASDQLAAKVKARLPQCEVTVTSSRRAPHVHNSGGWSRSFLVPPLDLNALTGIVDKQDWPALEAFVDDQVKAIRQAGVTGRQGDVEIELAKQLHAIADSLRFKHFERAAKYYVDAGREADRSIAISSTSEGFYRSLKSWRMATFSTDHDRIARSALAVLRLFEKSPPEGWDKSDHDDRIRCAALVLVNRNRIGKDDSVGIDEQSLVNETESWLSEFEPAKASQDEFSDCFSVLTSLSWHYAKTDCRQAAKTAARVFDSWDIGRQRIPDFHNYKAGNGNYAGYWYLMVGDLTSAKQASARHVDQVSEYALREQESAWLQTAVSKAHILSATTSLFAGDRTAAEQALRQALQFDEEIRRPDLAEDILYLLGLIQLDGLPETFADELFAAQGKITDSDRKTDLQLMLALAKGDRNAINTFLQRPVQRDSTMLLLALHAQDTESTEAQRTEASGWFLAKTLGRNFDLAKIVAAARLKQGWDEEPLSEIWSQIGPKK